MYSDRHKENYKTRILLKKRKVKNIKKKTQGNKKERDELLSKLITKFQRRIDVLSYHADKSQ